MLDTRRIIPMPLYTIVFLTSVLLIGFISILYFDGFSRLKFSFSENSKYLIILKKNVSKTTQLHLNKNLPLNDESKLIDLQNFQFLINHNICNITKPYLLILIHSAPGNLNKRNVIRETWGQQISSTTTFFLVGFSEKYNTKLENENMRYKDLIQGNFIDVYRNMTYKHVMALKWITYYCSNAKYVLKLDDDVFVHVAALVEFLKTNTSSLSDERLILCDSISTLNVKRSWRSKWRVSPKEYPDKKYPSYCAGWAILYSSKVVFLLYQEAQKTPFFWIDDIHVTGTLAKSVNISRTSMHSMILTKEMMKVILKNLNVNKKFLFGPPNLTENGIRALHNVITSIK